MKRAPIIVTGGAGFIGSHLVKRLVEMKREVVVVDRHVAKTSYFSREGLDRHVRMERMDIGNLSSVRKLATKYPNAFVFHLAAETIVGECYERPMDTMRTNIMGTVHFLEALRLTPSWEGMVVASSDKAYGKTTSAYTETSPLAGDHPYDVSKSAADLIALAYAKTYGSPVSVTRFGNVYGEGDPHMDRIVPGICRAAATGETLVIRSDGTYVRDYIYVEDVVDGYILLWQKFSETKGKAFNFSSKDTYSVLEVLALAEKSLGKKIPYTIANTAKNEIPYQHLTDRRVRALGWKNSYRLGDILPKVFDWYRNSL